MQKRGMSYKKTKKGLIKLKYDITIIFEDGHIEKAICDYYLFKQLEEYAITNDYELFYTVIE